MERAAPQLEPTWPAARPGQLVADGLLAVVLTAASLLPLVLGGLGEDVATARPADPLGVALVGVSAMPLALRRVSPLWALLPMLVAAAGLAALGYGVPAALGPAFGLAAVAARAPGGHVRVSAVVAVAVIAVHLISEAALVGAVSDPAWEAAAWGLGLALGLRRRAVRLAEMADEARAREQRDRERRLAVAEERAHLARELHDVAGHALNAIVLHAGAARLAGPGPGPAAQALRTVEAVARDTLGEIDAVVGDLRAATEASPGLAGLPALIELHLGAGLEVRVEDGAVPGPLPAAVDRAAYRIVQEALTNASRHGAGQVSLAVHRIGHDLELSVVNRTGDRASRTTGGRGVRGMRERAEALGGRLSVRREDDRFVLVARLPLQVPA